MPVRVRSLDVDLDCAYRIDMRVERKVVVDALAAGGSEFSEEGERKVVLRPLGTSDDLRFTPLTFSGPILSCMDPQVPTSTLR